MRHIYYMTMEDSQFIIATHSPILLGLPGTQILNFSDEGIQPIRYEDKRLLYAMKKTINMADTAYGLVV